MAVRDVITVAVMFFAVCIALYFVAFGFKTGYDALLANKNVQSSANTVNVLNAGNSKVVARYDYWAFACIVGWTLFIIISSWFIGGNPLYIFLYLMGNALAVIISDMLTNAWSTYVNTAALASVGSLFPITNLIMSSLSTYIIAVGFIGMVVIFAKPTGGI